MSKTFGVSLLSTLKSIGPALFIWAIMTAANTFKWLPKLMNGELPGNDDYMRLVQVREWVDGKAWTDLTQSRLFPPEPLLSHWARLSDVLVGGAIKFFSLFLSPAGAELAALFVVPSLLSLIMVILVVKLAQSLSGNPWIALTSGMMSALCAPIISQFSPGRIDHHGLQIVLALATAFYLIRSARRPSWMIAAGLCCGLGLWVGIEAAPFIAAASIATGLIWVLGEAHGAKRLQYFALSFFGSSAFFLLSSAPPSQWRVPTCDALSPVYLLLSTMVAAAMLVCSYCKISTPLKRLFLIAGLGTAGLAITLMVFPQCLRGPYAELDPRLAKIWLANVAEAKGLIPYLKSDPDLAISLIVIPVMAFIAMWLKIKRSGFTPVLVNNLAFRTLAIFISLSFMISFMQLRALTLAGAFAAPVAALLMANALVWSEKLSGDVKRALTRSGIIIGLSPLMAPLVLTLALNVSGVTKGQGKAAFNSAPNTSAALQMPECTSAAGLSGLQSLEAGFAITPIDLGARILAATENLSVSAAPYHRNEGGNIASLDVFMGTPQQAHDVVTRLSADYVIACKDYVETDLMTSLAPDGLLAQLLEGAVPSWLSPIDTGPNSPLISYVIIKE